MKKKILNLLLCSSLMCSCLAGCSSEELHATNESVGNAINEEVINSNTSVDDIEDSDNVPPILDEIKVGLSDYNEDPLQTIKTYLDNEKINYTQINKTFIFDEPINLFGGESYSGYYSSSSNYEGYSSINCEHFVFFETEEDYNNFEEQIKSYLTEKQETSYNALSDAEKNYLVDLVYNDVFDTFEAELTTVELDENGNEIDNGIDADVISNKVVNEGFTNAVDIETNFSEYFVCVTADIKTDNGNSVPNIVCYNVGSMLSEEVSNPDRLPNLDVSNYYEKCYHISTRVGLYDDYITAVYNME